MTTQPTFKSIDAMSYSEAIAELEGIIALMQSDKCDIDLLGIYTRRATELIAACRARLTATDAELRTILSSLENQQ